MAAMYMHISGRLGNEMLPPPLRSAELEEEEEEEEEAAVLAPAASPSSRVRVDALLLSGRRFCGKDTVAERIQAVFAAAGEKEGDPSTSTAGAGLAGGPPPLVLPVRVASFAAGCKQLFAAQSAGAVDLDKLLTDRAYKEEHRVALTAFYEDTCAAKGPEFFVAPVRDALAAFCSEAAAAAAAASDGGNAQQQQQQQQRAVFVVSDVRFPLEVQTLRDLAAAVDVDLRVHSIALTASDATRTRRGWVHSSAVDGNATENNPLLTAQPDGPSAAEARELVDHWLANDSDSIDTLTADVTDLLRSV